MNALPAEIINLMVQLVPTAYVVISGLNRWFRGCVIGDVEYIKTALVRQVRIRNEICWVLPNGAKHGKSINYRYANGPIGYDIDYVDGKRHGKLREYYFSGELCIVANYVNDQLCGKYVHHYSTGEIYYEAIYVDGKITDNAIYYNRAGKIIRASGPANNT